MLRREIRKYLYDMKLACELLEQFTVGKTLADYKQDPMLRSAVERQFSIIGEALSQALRLDSGLAPRITSTADIIAFRNRLIHGYTDVSEGLVWNILQTDLPALRLEVEALLAES